MCTYCNYYYKAKVAIITQNNVLLSSHELGTFTQFKISFKLLQTVCTLAARLSNIMNQLSSEVQNKFLTNLTTKHTQKNSSLMTKIYDVVIIKRQLRKFIRVNNISYLNNKQQTRTNNNT